MPSTACTAGGSPRDDESGPRCRSRLTCLPPWRTSRWRWRRHLREHQRVEDDGFWNAEIDQAGDFGHADLLDLLNSIERIVDRPEQPAVLEIALERELEDRVRSSSSSVCRSRIKRCWTPAGFLKAGNAHAYCLMSAAALRQVVLERPPRLLAHGFAVGTHEGVEHQGDV